MRRITPRRLESTPNNANIIEEYAELRRITPNELKNAPINAKVIEGYAEDFNAIDVGAKDFRGVEVYAPKRQGG